MHYVKQFNINGVDTKQVACIELQGAPNAATEGAVGVLGMDMASPTHEVYRCVAVNGSVYTWELLSAGMSVVSATITAEGAISKTFPYSNLLVPNNYLIKIGDLILDSEGYLYQISTIGSESCSASYTGTHIGGAGSGKDYTLRVTDGALQLVTGNGNVVSETTYMFSDDDTIYRDPATGEICAIGIRTVNGDVLRFFVGKQELYDTLTDAQKVGLFAIITDDPTREKILSELNTIKEFINYLIDCYGYIAFTATGSNRADTNITPEGYACTITIDLNGQSSKSQSFRGLELSNHSGFSDTPSVSYADGIATVRGFSSTAGTTCSATITGERKPIYLT